MVLELTWLATVKLRTEGVIPKAGVYKVSKKGVVEGYSRYTKGLHNFLSCRLYPNFFNYNELY